MKLGLGTVQFGMDYGISNKTGMTPPDEVARMLALAARAGVRCLDTAPAYAKSEEVLGAALPKGHSFELVSKTLKGDPAIAATFARTLQRLGQTRLDALLVHDGDALAGPNGAALFAELQKLKASGQVQKIGTIVYGAAQIDAVLERFPIDVIQIPISLLDQRLIQSGHLDRLKQKGVEIHARSVFLQGLLFMDPAALTPYFDSVRPHLQKVRAAMAAAGLSMLEATLGFVQQLPQIDRVVVGATTVAELDEIVRAATANKPVPGAAAWAWADEQILNPALWPKK